MSFQERHIRGKFLRCREGRRRKECPLMLAEVDGTRDRIVVEGRLNTIL